MKHIRRVTPLAHIIGKADLFLLGIGVYFPITHTLARSFLELHNRIPHTGWLKKLKFIFLWLCRLEI